MTSKKVPYPEAKERDFFERLSAVWLCSRKMCFMIIPGKDCSRILVSSLQCLRWGRFRVLLPVAQEMMTRESPKMVRIGILMSFITVRRAHNSINSDLLLVHFPHPKEKCTLWVLLKNKTNPAPPMFLAAAPSKYPQRKCLLGGKPINLSFNFLTGTVKVCERISAWWMIPYTVGADPSKIYLFPCFQISQKVN